jgi:hypothetical protein
MPPSHCRVGRQAPPESSAHARIQQHSWAEASHCRGCGGAHKQNDIAGGRHPTTRRADGAWRRSRRPQINRMQSVLFGTQNRAFCMVPVQRPSIGSSRGRICALAGMYCDRAHSAGPRGGLAAAAAAACGPAAGMVGRGPRGGGGRYSGRAGTVAPARTYFNEWLATGAPDDGSDDPAGLAWPGSSSWMSKSSSSSCAPSQRGPRALEGSTGIHAPRAGVAFARPLCKGRMVGPRLGPVVRWARG